MNNKKIALIGLGYVGLPLAVEFGKKRRVIGYDTNRDRIRKLKNHIDITLETSEHELREAAYLNYTYELEDLKGCEIFIIAVPTPIDKLKNPDLSFLKKASKSVGSLLKKGDIVIYESTVYPGATEDICAPILAVESGLIFNKDFYCGYSPERVNPGDNKHRLTDIIKVTSGSTPEITDEIDKLYQEIITAGTYKVNKIKIAEAAKVIENTQRDVNIALVNELAMIFNKLNIDTESVLKAAGTKWNFLPFRPGLVGGHCIGVDPYYLAHKALEVGYNPEIILAGRRLNDKMGSYVAKQVSKLMTKKGINVVGSNILLMGLTFKENCPDIRNTLLVDLVRELEVFNCNVDIYDPWVDKVEANRELAIEIIDKPLLGKYDTIIIGVAHNQFKNLSISEIHSFGKEKHLIYDVKYVFKDFETDGRL